LLALSATAKSVQEYRIDRGLKIRRDLCIT